MSLDRTLAFALFLLLAATGHAAEQKTITVIGSRSCAEWHQNRSSQNNANRSLTDIVLNAAAESWAIGFLSGLNAMSSDSKDVLHGVDRNVVIDWVDQFCRRNPSSDTYEAVFKLWVALTTEGTSAGAKAPAKQGENPTR
jgi:hypothetical protein